MNRIFVSIAAYRDTECQWTIKNLFAKAKFPQNIVVGVVWQVDFENDAACFVETFPNDKVRAQFVDCTDATGPCLARHLAMQLMTDDEQYFLQIDSHMRFAVHWDALLLHFFEQASALSSNPVITAYPAGYELPNKLPAVNEPWAALVASRFNDKDDGMLRISGRAVTNGTAGRVHACTFVAAGFLFCRASFARSALHYDTDLPQLFFGEELLLAVRLFRAGGRAFWPGAHVLYHLWSRAHRPTFRQPTPSSKFHWQRWSSQMRVYRALNMHFAISIAYRNAPWHENSSDRLSRNGALLERATTLRNAAMSTTNVASRDYDAIGKVAQQLISLMIVELDQLNESTTTTTTTTTTETNNNDDSVAAATRRSVDVPDDDCLKLARRSLVDAPFSGHGLFARADASSPIASLADFERFAAVDLSFGICDERSKDLGLSSNLFVDSLFASVMALIGQQK